MQSKPSLRTAAAQHTHPRRSPLNRALHIAFAGAAATLVVGGSFAPIVAHAQATTPATAEQRRYDIPAGPLEGTLNRLGREAGVLITFGSAVTDGVRSGGVSGSYAVEGALSQALNGTGLGAVRAAGGGYALRALPASPAAAAAAAAAAGGAPSLSQVTVTAAATSTTTEGTGSYTTPATAAATGLTLSLRDTPQSVSVLTRQQIEDQNITSLGQAMNSVTGVFAISSDTDRTDFYSRGFYVDNYQYDGVPTTVSTDFFSASTADPTAYDRIEIVRGATGLLTGAGEPSASINLVRKRADSKVFTGTASVGIGSWNQHRGTVDLQTPLTQDGRIRARFAATVEERDSFMDMYHGRKQALYGVIDADLTPDTKVSIGIDYQANKPTSSSWGGLPLVFSDGTNTNWDRSKTTAADWTYWNTKTTTTFASLVQRFDSGWKLKANFDHRESEQDAKLLYLYGSIDGATGTGLRALPGYFDYQFQQNSVNVQASGPFNLLGRQHEMVLGLSNTQSRYVQASYQRPSVMPSTGNFFLWDGSYAEPVWGALALNGVDKTRQTGFYAAARFSLAERLKLIVGGRASQWENESLTEKRSHSEFTPYAGLVYDLTDVYSLYASYTGIFKPQNYRDTSGTLLDPVTGTAYEAGIKGEHFNGALNTAFSVFRIEQENLAQRDGTSLVPNSTSSAYYGAKGVVSQGFEAQVSGELASGWNVSAGLARTVAVDGTGAALNTWAPRTMVTLFSTYRLPGDWHKLSLGGGLNWQNRVYYPVGTTVFEQGSFSVFNLMAKYDFTPQVSAQLNIGNVFDKSYYVNTYGQGYYGTPRNAQATLTYKF